MKYKYVHKDTITYARQILRWFNVSMVCSKRIKKDEAWPKGGVIYINKLVNEEDFLSAVSHELQHVLNFRNSKYPAYHSDDWKRFTKAVLYHGLQAELYTDKKAAKLCKEFFPWVKYQFGYKYKANQWWYKVYYKQEVKNDYRNYLKRLRS